ncbi:MAG: hypothetical protein NPIRA05_14590 [Nitrospirales bacterium]|nr:MAG: hypothetical protein NPIRA05_14590 [Nitrospirales bacterium]
MIRLFATQWLPRPWSWPAQLSVIMVGMVFLITSPPRVLAGGFESPQECLAYDHDAHLNCLYAYIEIQQDTIGKLETRLNEATRSSQQLQDHVNQQRSVNGRLQQRIRDYSRALDTYRSPRLRDYSGFSYGFGRPRYDRRLFQPHLGFHLGHDNLFW